MYKHKLIKCPACGKLIDCDNEIKAQTSVVNLLDTIIDSFVCSNCNHTIIEKWKTGLIYSDFGLIGVKNVETFCCNEENKLIKVSEYTFDFEKMRLIYKEIENG